MHGHLARAWSSAVAVLSTAGLAVHCCMDCVPVLSWLQKDVHRLVSAACWLLQHCINAAEQPCCPPAYGGPATAEHVLSCAGHHFWLLATGNHTFNAATDSASFNLDNPVFRDSLYLPGGGWAALRFVAVRCSFAGR